MTYDVIIVGGSYSGLSAAMALGRSLRKVLVIDSGKPCNIQTPHSHNFLTQDGEAPADIAAKARGQVLQYDTVKLIDGHVASAEQSEDGFRVSLETGDAFRAKKLVFATGVKDIMPEIEGFAECWGISAIHCPYCHGYEPRGERTGILANGYIAYHYAQMVSNLTDDLTIFTNGSANFSDEQLAKLAGHNIEVVQKEVAKLNHTNGHLQGVQFKDGNSHALTALYSRPVFVQHCDIPEMLGVKLNEQGFIVVDMLQKTTVDGVFACGDNTTPMRSVAHAVAAGNVVGSAVNNELVREEF